MGGVRGRGLGDYFLRNSLVFKNSHIRTRTHTHTTHSHTTHTHTHTLTHTHTHTHTHQPMALARGSSAVPRAPRTFKRSKWHLGIRSQSRPQDIMAEIFRKLKALEFQWKIITPYFIRCRWVGQRAEWVVGGASNG